MIQIAGKPISSPEILSSLKTSNSGSLIIHVGVVRSLSEGKKVVSIEYQIDQEEAERELSNIASEIHSNWEIDDIALCRRAGQLNFGEVILIAAVAGPRHKAAFEACQCAVEKMKNMTSVTKREIFAEQRASLISPPPADPGKYSIQNERS